jgi:hypothetical protein
MALQGEPLAKKNFPPIPAIGNARLGSAVVLVLPSPVQFQAHLCIINLFSIAGVP